MALRANLTQNWVKYIQFVVDGHNNTPIKKLGWLKPSQIHSQYDSTLVENQKQKFNIESYQEPSFENQKQLQKQHEANKSKLQIDDFVYLDLNEKLFDKSFDIQVLNSFQFFFITKKIIFLYVSYYIKLSVSDF